MDTSNDIKQIDKLYKHLSYLDQYGGSVILLIIITIIVGLICSYCFVMMNVTPIQQNWPQERCKPYILPFAGLINAPKGESVSDYTSENFNYCTQNILSSIAGFATEPITFITNFLSLLIDEIKDSLNDVRGMFNKVRTLFQTITQEIMNRLMNIMIPLQRIIISMKDFLSKIQGTMTSGLYTLMGSYMTLVSLFGAIAQFIIIILIIMAAAVIIMWIIPFTWPFAAIATTVFLTFSIPMAIILSFMIEFLHVKPNMEIPTLKCFDKNTKIKMNNNQLKFIKDIQVDDLLKNNIKVTAKIKVDTKNSKMFNLNNIIVSDSHIVLYKEKWIKVCDHPDAVPVSNYKEPYLYCLNTESKIININNIVFSDWDDLYGEKLEKIKQRFNFKSNSEIHKKLDSGFLESTEIPLVDGSIVTINEIKIGDILNTNQIVYGVVEISADDLTLFKYLINGKSIYGSSNLIYKNNNKISSTNNLDPFQKQVIFKDCNKIYHLLVTNQLFSTNSIDFLDYNAAIDLFLEKS
jgi:hypothetical protein